MLTVLINFAGNMNEVALKFRNLLTLPGIKSPVKRELVWLTVPIFIETLLIMSLGAIDTFMLSRISDASVGAVGLSNQIVSFCFIIFEVINLGTAVLCAQYLGASQAGKLEVVVGVSLVVNFVFGILISALLFFFPEQIMSYVGLKGEMLPIGARYMKIVGAFAFVQALSMTLSACLRSVNKAYWPMLVVLVVNILNIIGNYIFIFGKFGAPALGAEGAAISTVTARCVATTALFIIVYTTTIRRFPLEILRHWPSDIFRNLMKIGLPSAGEQMSYYFSQLFIAFFITGLGLEALATRTYCTNVILYTYIFCIAIAHGGAIIIGHQTGGAKWRAAFITGKYVLKVAVIITLCLSLILAICGKWIMEALTENPEIIRMGVTIFWIDLLLEIGRPINIFATNALQSAGDVNYPFYVGVICMWSIAVGLAYLVGITWGFGLIGIWWMFCLDENVRGAIFIHRWWSLKWQHKSFVHK